MRARLEEPAISLDSSKIVRSRDPRVVWRVLIIVIMFFQVSRNRKLLGEFSETMMSHKLYSGELRPEDLYRGEGMQDWRPLSQYGGVAPTAPPLPTMRNQSAGPTNDGGFLLVIDSASALGFSGSLILLLGVFAPALSVPLLGSVNYLQNGHGVGGILIVTALASAVLTARRLFRGLGITGSVTVICLAATLISFAYEARQMKASAGRIQNRMFADLGAAAVDAVQLEWGLAVLFVGGVVLLVAAGVGTGKMRLVR
jgi:hypothetical protein